MRTQRLVPAGVAALALVGGGGTALAVNGAAPPAVAGEKAGGEAREAAAVQASARPTASRTAGPRVVRPYRPVEIGRGAKMGLLPEGRQNSVVGPGDIGESVEQARKHSGDNIRPDSLSSGTYVDEDHVLFHGAFRADTPPAGIDIVLDSGPRHTATMLSLPGDPGWGTYHAFGDASTADTGFTVMAYAEDGGVLFEQRSDVLPRD
ncbi:hypothetical protein [Streptomyces incanus]|uniref:Lipoprotein n=1 Tax=Streptomyces incanus TaxID=887453 RepID=A0ABW0XJJ4_9ACTN